MKVIFTSNVAGVASRGDMKNVKNGYFRNFLLPRNCAIFATPANLKKWEDVRKQMMIERQELKTKFEEIKRRLMETCIKIEKKVTVKGTLYGGVKTSDIVSALRSQFNIDVPSESVKLPEAIKKVGGFDIVLELGEGVTAMVKVEVSAKQ